MFRHLLRILLVTVTCLTFFISASSVTLASSATATIILSVTSGPPTSNVTVSGTNFGNNETITVEFDTTVVGTTTTDNSGAFSTPITVPSSATPGNHTILASGQSSGLSASATFLVRTDWSMYGFDPEHTQLNPYENVINTANASGLVQKWSVHFSSRVFVSASTLANGIVYIASHKNNTSGSSNEKMYAFDANTGATLWTFTAGDATAAAVVNGIVYFGSADKHLYALDAMTGAKIWAFKADGSAGTPTVVNGVVYFDAGSLYALNAATGAMIWTTPNVSGSAPVAEANGMLYIGTIDAKLYALDANTGNIVWKHTFANACCIDTSPAVAGGIVYVGVSFINKLYALNATTGAVIWSVTFSFGATSPAVANGVVYIGSTIYLYALNATTGKQIWKFATGGDVSNPSVANGVVYLGSNDTFVYAIDAMTGKHLWKATTLGRIRDAPTVADGVVYVGTVYYAGHLRAYHLPGMAS